MRTKNFKHGYSPHRNQHPLYKLWSAIKNRCLNQNGPAYPDYGGRGIEVCEEWKNDPMAFIRWAKAHGWQPNLVIDRIDNDGDYSPNNCRFATRKINSRNTRRNRILEAFGERKSIAEWCDDVRARVKGSTLWARVMQYNWSPEKAISTPPKFSRWSKEVNCVFNNL